MFTLEDFDLAEATADLGGMPLGHLGTDLLDEGHPSPEADVRDHPADYFIVGA